MPTHQHDSLLRKLIRKLTNRSKRERESLTTEAANVTKTITFAEFFDDNGEFDYDAGALWDGKLVVLPDPPIVLENLVDDDEISQEEYEQWLIDEYYADLAAEKNR